MQRNRCKRMFATICCLLLLSTLLLLSGCGNSNPGSPGSHPSPGGYSLINLLEQEVPFMLAPHSR